LFRAARLLQRRSGAPSRLPPLLFFTDPARTPDPLAVVSRLPRGCGVVYRSFGAAEQVRCGRALARLARRRGVRLLVGADLRLARQIKAEGAHLPERLANGRRVALWPGATLSAAAHGPAGLRRAQRLGADAAVLSPVFASSSPSAGRPLGLRKARRMAGAAKLPVYALGGVGPARMPIGPFCGVAAVEAMVEAAAIRPGPALRHTGRHACART